jgi:hypothetical protein
MRPIRWLLICGQVLSSVSCGDGDGNRDIEAALRSAFEARCDWIADCCESNVGCTVSREESKENCMGSRTEVFSATDECQEAYVKLGECLAGPGALDCEADISGHPCNHDYNGLSACGGPDGDDQWAW